jgi:hypothetical protein
MRRSLQEGLYSSMDAISEELDIIKANFNLKGP